MYQESQAIELKSSFSEWKEAIISLSAFANAQGGMVVFGVDDNGQPTGIQIGKSSIEDFLNKVRNHTDPILYPSVNVQIFGIHQIVEVEIKQSAYKPVFAFGTGHIRVGKTNQKLSVQAIRELIHQYSPASFDGEFTNTALQDFQYEKELSDKIEFNSLIQNSSFVKDGKISNALYLLMCKENDLFWNAHLKVGLFKGTTPVHFLDNKILKGNLVQLVHEGMTFIKKHLEMAYIITTEPVHEERWQLSLGAIRESLINAIVHRDYSDPGNVQIRMFDDRLEIWSPGLLPPELNIETLGTEARSYPRNKNIAKLFHKLGLIEWWGTGFSRMQSYCQQVGLPPPEHRISHSSLVTTYYKKAPKASIYFTQVCEGVNVSNGGVNLPDEGVNNPNGGVNLPDEGVNSSNGGVNLPDEGVSTLSGGVNDPNGGVIEKLLGLIERNEGIRKADLCELLRISERTLERYLQKLIKSELVEYKGAPKNGGYFVKNGKAK